jgi:hypothetical protein
MLFYGRGHNAVSLVLGNEAANRLGERANCGLFMPAAVSRQRLEKVHIWIRSDNHGEERILAKRA